jgi:hypothetical protein
MGSWWRGIAQNLISTAIVAVVGLIVSALAIWVTYLTPSFRAFAPVSYFFGALIALVLVAVLAERGMRTWRHYNPVSPEAPKTSVRLGKGVAAYDDATLKIEVAEARKMVDIVVGDHQELGEKIDQILLRIGTVDRDLRNEMDKLGDQLKALEEKDKVIIQDYQTVVGNGQALSAKVDGARDALLQAIKAVEVDLGEVRRGCANLESNVEKNEKYVRQSLYAVFAREQLKELSAEIERDADDLYLRLKSGENYTDQDWDQWTNVAHHWEGAVRAWVDTARWYAMDVKKVVLTVEDKEYDGGWDVKDSQFPSADAVRRFKRHRIIHSHWTGMKEAVESGLRLVAFQSGTEQEQHGGKHH